MSDTSSWDPTGEALAALQTAVNDYGPRALSSSQMLGNLLKDLLPDRPREASLIVSAAEIDVAGVLVSHRQANLDAETAIRLTAAALAEARPIDPQACLWVTTQFATVLGFLPHGAMAAVAPAPEIEHVEDTAPVETPAVPGDAYTSVFPAPIAVDVPPAATAPAPTAVGTPLPPAASFASEETILRAPDQAEHAATVADSADPGAATESPVTQPPPASPAWAAFPPQVPPVATAQPDWTAATPQAPPVATAQPDWTAATPQVPPVATAQPDWTAATPQVPVVAPPVAPPTQAWQPAPPQTTPTWPQAPATWDPSAAAAGTVVPPPWPPAPQQPTDVWAQPATAFTGAGVAGAPPGAPPVFPGQATQASGGPPFGASPAPPTKGPKRSRAPLAVLGVLVLVGVYFAVAAIAKLPPLKASSAATTTTTAITTTVLQTTTSVVNTTTTSTSPTTTSRPPTTSTPLHSRSLSIAALMPDQQSTDPAGNLSTSKCVSVSPLPKGLVGVKGALACLTVPGYRGWELFGYKFSSATSYSKSFQAYDSDKGFDSSTAKSTCPSSGTTSGETGWHSQVYPARNDQVLQCLFVEFTGSNVHHAVYIWTVPSQSAFFEMVAAPAVTGAKLETWWENDGGPGHT